eukprot:scaffold53096_cov53-Attheya_sp.AAC.1
MNITSRRKKRGRSLVIVGFFIAFCMIWGRNVLFGRTVPVMLLPLEDVMIRSIVIIDPTDDNGCGKRFGLTKDGDFGYFVDSTMSWEPDRTKDKRDTWKFQSNGNLVVHKSDDGAVWASEWDSKESVPGSLLVMSNTSVTIKTSTSGREPTFLPAPTRSLPSSGELLYLSYYYPWYNQGDWSRHEIQDIPELGLYGTDDPALAEQHIEWAIHAGISSWVVSGWGPGSLSNRHFAQGILKADNIGQIKFCMLYESMKLTGSFEDGTAQSKLTSDIRSIRDEYFDHPSYLCLNGRPVIVLYITRFTFGQGFGSHVLDAIRDELDEDIFFIADEPFFGNGHDDPDTAGNGIRNGEPVFETYMTYNMYQHKKVIPGETASDFMLREAMPIFERWSEKTLFFPNVLPMLYHNFRGKKPLGGNTEDVLRQLEAISCLKRPDGYDHSYPDLVFVTLFNEWWEGSQIEPNNENRYGFEFIDALAGLKKDVDSNGYYWC